MPELPEVETVRRGLEKIVEDHPVIACVKLNRADIRFPIPKNLPELITGQPITGIRRRAKYLLIETPKATVISHLGMTGSWRVAKPGDADIHDHCLIEFKDGRTLVFRDPRRFGVLDLALPGTEETHIRLKDLGPEPLDTESFHAEMLFERTRKRRVPIKAFIMDQRVVVGVGNIYASEVLFQAKIKPSKLAGRITKLEAERIVIAVREILKKAIAAGGSSIRDYVQAGGESGSFQDAHRVYDRGGEPCPVCRTKIRSKVIGGRSTYWCPSCQR